MERRGFGQRRVRTTHAVTPPAASIAVPSQLLVRWWAEYDGGLLERSVVAPMQAFLTQELAVTKRLTVRAAFGCA